ncbi:hypothetical protein K493DRAFT_319329 [Basidiobolus meristosporus CBS 931.73]|uniref:Xanthine/uracil permease n=1 Tax=Basidiobolus meristosporus CBS 931.73 TaxID=1314790 RepID=A0A1Y1XSB7_9FUNG|nr:hypothetical protein K493DRAFT_319329 [Basidiobolus meristosporus CBS 931.73]|eukprot:ORX88628.1 hypothetical protein K493DRAFT_319329 [Basidiobolus meristosporus CBS 931.73]
MGFIVRLNENIARSPVGKWFKLEGSGAKGERANTKFSSELRAGLATFVTMAYIISVNSTIISETGGTCECKPPAGATGSAALCVGDPVYEECVTQIKRDLITATAAISAIACIAMGSFANLPFALAPGMGINAYFTYTVVGFHGSGKVSYKTALAAVFIEGIFFVVLSVLGIRQWLAKLIPNSIKIATGAGIGLYLCFIGLQSSAGIGLITADPATLVTLGGCDPTNKNENGQCLTGKMEGPTVWMGIFGFFLITMLTLFRVKGAVLFGVLLVAIISWFRGTTVTYFPYTPKGDEAFEFFKQVVTFHPIKHTLAVFDFGLNHSDVWIALITMLYVDILDATGTMFSMAKFGGFTDENGNFEGLGTAFIVDGFTIIIGSVFGVSPVTVFVESGAGITDGGRTGITAITVGFFFFLSVFLSPIFASFPPWATGPALIVIGSMMTKSVKHINWDYLGDAVPAFLTIALMPLTYSIAYGLVAGICAYIAINVSAWAVVRLSRGRIHLDRSQKEAWNNFKMDDGQRLMAPWVYKIKNMMFGKQKSSEDLQSKPEVSHEEVSKISNHV